MKLGTLAAIAGAALLLVFLVVEVLTFAKQEREVAADFAAMQQKLASAQKDNSDLKAQVQYLQNPANLEKELRAKFNYRGADEKMIILVPGTSTASSSSSTPPFGDPVTP